MKALLYLTVRSLLNSIRRAFTSGRRMIGLIFLALYYIFFFVRPFDRPSQLPRRMLEQPLEAPLDVVHAIIFALFSALTLILAMGIFAPRAGFKPADVDVLFPTPINPKVVLVFRMFRDYIFTLLFPLMIALLSWRPASMGLEVLFSNLDPNTVHYLGRAWTLSWMLMSLAWVSLSYAVSMFVNRSDLDSDRNRRLFTYGTIVFIVAVAGYMVLRTRGFINTADWVTLGWDPLLRTIFFTASFATMAVMGPITGDLISSAIGLACLASITVVGIRIALTQVGWLYDQAAARGFDSLKTRDMQRQGDMLGVLAEQARRGKLKSGKGAWLNRIRVQGPLGILWREAVIQARGMWGVLALFTAMVLFMSLMPVFIDERGTGGTGLAFLLMQSLGAFMLTTIVGQSGFIELLRRVDTEKPLPFTSTTIALAEIAAKAMPAVLILWIASLVSLAVQPGIWIYILGAILLAPGLCMLFSSALFTLTVLFPDVDDPMQRGFRGLMTFLALVLLMTPVVGIFAFGYASLREFVFWPLLSAVGATVMCVALTIVVAYIGGNLYASFNPSD